MVRVWLRVAGKSRPWNDRVWPDNAGADTVICSRKLARVTEAAKRLSAATGRECMPLALDVRNPAQIKEAVATAVEKFGKIDILVNGAAGNFLCPASSMSYNAFKTVMEIDAHGTFNVTKAVFDASMQQHGGSVLNITATLHYKGDLLQAHAGAAKAAIGAAHPACALVCGLPD